jgi:hypothetical protein
MINNTISIELDNISKLIIDAMKAFPFTTSYREKLIQDFLTSNMNSAQIESSQYALEAYVYSK